MFYATNIVKINQRYKSNNLHKHITQEITFSHQNTAFILYFIMHKFCFLHFNPNISKYSLVDIPESYLMVMYEMLAYKLKLVLFLARYLCNS